MKNNRNMLSAVAGAFGSGIIICFILPVKVLLLTAVSLFVLAICLNR